MNSPSDRPEARTRRGLVASPHTLASEAGLAILREGGNALDAAVAAAVTIAVVYPHMNSIGGDSFWLIYDARNATLRVLNAAGRSAAAVDADAPRARYGTALPTRGGAAALTVPGAVSGWWEAHRASRAHMRSPVPWKSLFKDAIAHARSGFSVSAGQRRVTTQAAALFAEDVAEEIKRSFWPIYHPDRLASGRFAQPDLAATLNAIAEGGAEEFYRGDLGRWVWRALPRPPRDSRVGDRELARGFPAERGRRRRICSFDGGGDEARVRGSRPLPRRSRRRRRSGGALSGSAAAGPASACCSRTGVRPSPSIPHTPTAWPRESARRTR